MAEKVLKNIESEKKLKLAELVEILPGQVVSKTPVQNRAVSVTLFAFDKGEEISSHESGGDALVTVLSGKGLFDGRERVAHSKRASPSSCPQENPTRFWL